MTNIPNFDSLTEGEKFIVKWQYHLLGSFFTALANAIATADRDNQYRLRKSFPEEVSAMIAFKEIDGYWSEVQKKAGIIE